ncbi:hypothetical protein V8B97DRAFT_1992824 [Scleroderma yunnanense]
MPFEVRELGGRPGRTGMGADDEEQNGQGRRLSRPRESTTYSLPRRLRRCGWVRRGIRYGGYGHRRCRHVWRAPVDEATMK